MASTCRTYKRWGPPCPFCVNSALHPSSQGSNWSDKEWDDDRVREQKKKVDSNLATNTTTTAAYTDVDCPLDTETTPICQLDPCLFEINPDQPHHIWSLRTGQKKKGRNPERMKSPMPITLQTQCMMPHSNKTPCPTISQKRNWPWIWTITHLIMSQKKQDRAPFLVNNLVPPPVEHQEKNDEGTNKNKQEQRTKNQKTYRMRTRKLQRGILIGN